MAPSPALAPFVRRFTIVETSAEATRALLPEHGLVLGVRFGGSASLVVDGVAQRVPDLAVTGILGAARTMRSAAGGGIVLAMFRELGAARFFAEPLHELFGRTLGADALVPRAELARLQQRIASARDHAGRVAIFEQFLLARMRPGEPDPVAAAAAPLDRVHRGAAARSGSPRSPASSRSRRIRSRSGSDARSARRPSTSRRWSGCRACSRRSTGCRRPAASAANLAGRASRSPPATSITRTSSASSAR